MLGNVGEVDAFFSEIGSYIFTSKGQEKNTRKFKPERNIFNLLEK